VLAFASALGGAAGCASTQPALQATLKPLDLGSPPAPPLRENLFRRDHAGSISEEDLRRVLAAPVFLEDKARLGVVPVATGYEPETDLPLQGVPAVLGRALEDSGLFEVTTEVSTDFPADRGVSGLRELAARYRSPYLLLYRERFVDRAYTNGWAWLYPTVVGIFFVPAQTLETAGVVEATLFDVRTGTLLFTVYERVHKLADANLWHNDNKVRGMKSALLEQAARKLADQVVDKARRLAAARPRASPPAQANAPLPPVS